MLAITQEFKERVVKAILESRERYSGSDAQYASVLGMNKSVYSQLKNGASVERLLSDAKLLMIGRKLNVQATERSWKFARTIVFERIEEEVLFCKEFSKSRIFVDKCAIGKTYSAKILAQKLENCFYVDASQAKTERAFARLLAQTIGADTTGTIADIKESIKYFLNSMPAPVVIIDEAGDLQQTAFIALKEYWNATDGRCGWFLMGAEGFRLKLMKGTSKAKESYKEIFSRFSDRFSSIVPANEAQRIDFYRRLLSDVLKANMADSDQLNRIVNRCLSSDQKEGELSGLRRAESLLILENMK